jgi:hypothetical protein
MRRAKRFDAAQAWTRRRSIACLALFAAAVLSSVPALGFDTEVPSVSSTDCKEALSKSDTTIQKLEADRDRFASRKRMFIIIAGIVTALSGGIAAASPKTKQRLITSLLASLCGALTVASQWYDPQESDKETLNTAKKEAESRRGLLIDGSDTLIDSKGEGDSQVVACLERRALKQFTRCVSHPTTGKDPEPCPRKTEPDSQGSAFAPVSNTTGISPSAAGGAGSVRGTGGAATSPKACSTAVRTVLASKTTTIAGKISDPRHGQITVSVAFRADGSVDSVKHAGGNGTVLSVVDGVVRSGVKGEADCQTSFTYQW